MHFLKGLGISCKLSQVLHSPWPWLCKLFTHESKRAKCKWKSERRDNYRHKNPMPISNRFAALRQFQEEEEEEEEEEQEEHNDDLRRRRSI